MYLEQLIAGVVVEGLEGLEGGGQLLALEGGQAPAHGG